MIRFVAAAAAAAVLTTGAVAALADPVQSDQPKVRFVAKTGEYCIETPAVTGSIITNVRCQTEAGWAKDGVLISRR